MRDPRFVSEYIAVLQIQMWCEDALHLLHSVTRSPGGESSPLGPAGAYRHLGPCLQTRCLHTRQDVPVGAFPRFTFSLFDPPVRGGGFFGGACVAIKGGGGRRCLLPEGGLLSSIVIFLCSEPSSSLWRSRLRWNALASADAKALSEWASGSLGATGGGTVSVAPIAPGMACKLSVVSSDLISHGSTSI